MLATSMLRRAGRIFHFLLRRLGCLARIGRIPLRNTFRRLFENGVEVALRREILRGFMRELPILKALNGLLITPSIGSAAGQQPLPRGSSAEKLLGRSGESRGN
jgi:hypothetical protein